MTNETVFSFNWSRVFLPSQSIIETAVRGVIMYFALFILLRVLGKEPASVSISDLLVLVLIADAAQNGMAGGYTSLTDGIILVTVILFCSWLLDVLAFKFAPVRRLVHPLPIALIEDGRLIYRNMRREYISEIELMSQLREQGIDDIMMVKRAYMEGDGKISIIRK